MKPITYGYPLDTRNTNGRLAGIESGIKSAKQPDRRIFFQRLIGILGRFHFTLHPRAPGPRARFNSEADEVVFSHYDRGWSGDRYYWFF